MTDSELRQHALNLIQGTDTSSLLLILKQIADSVHAIQRHHNPSAPAIDVDALFLQYRKQLLHLQLEDQERTDPALAARLQQVIDKNCTNFPFDYE